MPQVSMEELIRDLSLPAAYPHPATAVQVHQTHISCVFLAGEFAYKIKKPVRLEFLNYESVANRLAYCRREVELNRRLCPEVYLGVVPIVRSGGRLRVGDGGGTAARATSEALEWCVKMRRLPTEEMLPGRLAARSVGEAEIHAIAEVLSGFHSRAATSPQITSYGRPHRVLALVSANLKETRGLDPHLLPPVTQRVAEGWFRQALSRRRNLLSRRATGGWIRDGHGDLRADNVCLAPGIQGGVQIFDCIEFNDRFRYADTAADLAYLAMDLDLAGRPELRRSLVTACAARGHDPELNELIDLYRLHRSWVRGKIAAMAAEESEIPGAERSRHADLAAAAFDLSRSYCDSSPPTLVVMSGLSGSGKSMIASGLAGRMPAVLIRSDVVRKELAGLRLHDRLPNEAYGEAARHSIYERMLATAADWLGRREHVILDATFARRGQRLAARELAIRCGARFRVVECVAMEPVLRERLEARRRLGADPSDADLSVLARQQCELEPIAPSEAAAGEHVRLETAGPPAVLCRAALLDWWSTSLAE